MAQKAEGAPFPSEFGNESCQHRTKMASLMMKTPVAVARVSIAPFRTRCRCERSRVRIGLDWLVFSCALALGRVFSAPDHCATCSTEWVEWQSLHMLLGVRVAHFRADSVVLCL